MRMTKREKMLLAVLLFSVLFFASYRFLVVDQRADIGEGETTLADLQERIVQLEVLEETSRRLDEDMVLVKVDQAVVIREFLSLIDEQEEIILLLNEFLLNPNVNATSLSFTPPTSEEVDGIELYSMDVTMAYQSNYPALLNFFRSIWRYERKIIINQLVMNGTDAQQLSGNFQIRFYDLSQVTGDLDRLFSWLLTIQEMRENPFTGAGPGIALRDRYVLILPVEIDEAAVVEPEEEPIEEPEEELEEVVEAPTPAPTPTPAPQPPPPPPPAQPTASEIIARISSLEVLNPASLSPTIMVPISTTGEYTFVLISASAGEGAAINIAGGGSSASVLRNPGQNQNRSGSITLRATGPDGSTATKTYSASIPNGYSTPYGVVTVFE